MSLVESSGDAMRQIVGEVSAVSDLVDEIAEAAEKQATGIAEISDMVSSMDRFTQANAAMVEQTSAGTRNLSEETGRLVDQLQRFNVGDADHGPAHMPAPTRAAWRDDAPVARAQAAPAFDGNAALKAAPQDDEWSEF